MIRITHQHTLLPGSSTEIEEATIEHHGKGGTKEFKRRRLRRTDAAVVCVYNRDRHTVVCVKQFRYAIHDKIEGQLLELVAGKIDEGESPEQAAIRETAEECGYRVEPANLHRMASYFVSPGYTPEMFHLFFASVGDADRLGNGGGLEDENEFIDVEEVGLELFLQMADAGTLTDGKALMAALLIKLNKDQYIAGAQRD